MFLILEICHSLKIFNKILEILFLLGRFRCILSEQESLHIHRTCVYIVDDH